MPTLWDHPLSPYAQKVRIALREKGVAFDSVVPGGIGVGGAGGDFLAANPRAEVPALIDGDVRVFDSTIILEYIEDRWPAPPLLPAAPGERARARMIEEVVDTQLEAINWGLMEIRAFGRAEGEQAARMVATAAEQTRGLFAWLERELSDRDWFGGAAFGWADVAVVPYVAGSVAHGNAPADGSPLAAWLTRTAARPAVAATLAEARAVAGTMGDVAAMVKAGLFKREYRDHRLEWMMKSGGVDVVLAGLADDTIRFMPDLH